MTASVETVEFRAEARELLQLMVHSIYSNKDIFLRELISNASDALDKLRLLALVDKDLSVDTSDLHIDIKVEASARTLTVRDNGIGMSRDEVVELIGTIAKSGTAEFLRSRAESRDGLALIGSFGVGFYSTFMVADRVSLVTRRAGQDAGTRWESAGDGTYTLEQVDDAPQGTEVTLHLKPADADDHLYDYTADWKIREIVKRYSDFIAWPIRLGEEPLNSMKALWARPAAEVEQAEYDEFYRHISHDWAEPLDTVRMKAEGAFEYEALLFIPSRAPFDLHQRNSRRGLQLYVRRVFIMDECAALMPEYLRFVAGVVDAQDLSLNISREILQQDRQIELMRRRLVKKVLGSVEELMAEHPDRYGTFWTAFGSCVKEGLLGDFDNQQAILNIASFASTHDSGQTTTLHQYVERMPDGQEHIYYLCGESVATVQNSPHLEAFAAKGYEVLLLTDPVDEMWVDMVPEFGGQRLQSIAKGEVDLTDDEEQQQGGAADRDQQRQDFQPLLSWLDSALADHVKQVRLSSRLTTSVACLVGDELDMTPNLEKMYRAMGRPVPAVKRILELNPAHPLVEGLRQAHADHPDDPVLVETSELVYALALLAEGGELDDPSRFSRLMADRLTRTL
jgi:molecular chaperone HtpG